MGTEAATRPATDPVDERKGFTPERIFGWLSVVPQVGLGLLPRSCLRVLMWLVGKPADEARGIELLGRTVAAFVLAFIGYQILLVAFIIALAIFAHLFPVLVKALADAQWISPDSGWLNKVPAPTSTQTMYAVALAYLTGLFVRAPHDAFAKPFRVLRGMLWLRQVIAQIAGFLFLMGLGLLPLASLLMFLPIVMPQEAVLTDTVSPARTALRRFLRRAFAFVAGLVVLLALLTLGTQLVTWTGLRSTVYGEMARQIIGPTIAERLPRALVDGWPFVLLVVYATDFLLLFAHWQSAAAVQLPQPARPLDHDRDDRRGLHRGGVPPRADVLVRGQREPADGQLRHSRERVRAV